MLISSVVIAYYPDVKKLIELCDLLGRDSEVIVVDNTPMADAVNIVDGVFWIPMRENAGIAAAQNAGIRRALENNASAIAFFDQDSQPNQYLIKRLIAALIRSDFGVVAPLCVDMRTGNEYSSFRINGYGLARPVVAMDQINAIPVDLVISSGTVVTSEALRVVGLMDEDFFIDYVDFEWCFRCRSLGVSIGVIPEVKMAHAIGDKVVKTGPFTTFIHSPVRSYYRLRNAFLLLHKSHIPFLYGVHQIVAAIVHHCLQYPHTSDRRLHIKLGFRALLDGVRGVKGKMKTVEGSAN